MMTKEPHMSIDPTTTVQAPPITITVPGPTVTVTVTT